MTQIIDPSPLFEKSPPNPVALGDLAGVWKRTLIVEADGTRDEISTVYWLQLGSLCGDIRLPGPGTGTKAAAFAGCLTERDGIFRWTPEISRGIPSDAEPDEGYLKWEGGILREDGVHRPYLEHWMRVAEPGPQDYALRFQDDGECVEGYLICIADFAFHACRPVNGTPCFALARETDRGWLLTETLSDRLKPGEPFVWPAITRDMANATGTAGCKFGTDSVVTFERIPVSGLTESETNS